MRADHQTTTVADRDYSEDRDVRQEDAVNVENSSDDEDTSKASAISETDNVLESAPIETPTENPILHSDKSRTWPKHVIAIAVCILAILVALIVYQLRQPNTCNVSQLETKFPKQDEHFWTTLKIGIESTINKDPTVPSVFLFVYQDKELIERFASQIVELTQNCMHTKQNAPVILDNFNLSSGNIRTDYGNAIEQYKRRISDSGVLLVKDLNTVSSLPFVICRLFKI